MVFQDDPPTMAAVAARGQNVLDESVWRYLPPGRRHEVEGVFREGNDLVVVLVDGRQLRVVGCFANLVSLDAGADACAVAVSAGDWPETALPSADSAIADGEPVALGRLDEMFARRESHSSGDMPFIADWLGLSDQELGLIVLIIGYLYERTSVFGGGDDGGGGLPREQQIVQDLGLEGADETSAEIAVKSFETVFGEEALAALTGNPEEVDDEAKAQIQGLLNIVNAYLNSQNALGEQTVTEDRITYGDGEVVLGLDLTGDGSADVTHTWMPGGAEEKLLAVNVDVEASETIDAVFLLEPAQQTAAIIVAEVDFERDGTGDATLYGDGISFDRLVFDMDDAIEVRDVDAAYLAGVREVSLADNGVTEISITVPQLEALGSGQEDGYTLRINGDSSDIVLVSDGTLERLPRQDRETYRAYSVPGVTIEVDKDITFGIGEGAWRDLSLLRQLSIDVAPPGSSQQAAVKTAEQVLMAYGVLFGTEIIDGLREDPSSAEAEQLAGLQGLARLYGAYLTSGYNLALTERQDRVTLDLDADDDGSTDAVHHWSLSGDVEGALELSVDNNADDTVDAVVVLVIADQDGTALRGQVDFDGDGTAETAVIDGGGDWGSADLVIDRIEFTGNQTVVLATDHARLLGGIKEVQMATNGVTDISISPETLSLLADGDRDGSVDHGYTLTVEADIGDVLALPALSISPDTSQDTTTHRAFSLMGATLLLDRDVTLAIGEGAWREMAVLRQAAVQGANQRNAGWLLESYGALYGAEAMASLRESPDALEPAHLAAIQGMVPLVNTYLQSEYQGKEPTFGVDMDDDGTPDLNVVVFRLDREDDGTVEAIHTWTLDADGQGIIEIAVDQDADTTTDQTLFVSLPGQTGPQLELKMDWSGNGVNDVTLTDGSPIAPGNLVIDSMSLSEELQLTLTDEQARFLAGIRDIQMDGDSTSGTTLAITDAQLTLLADGNGDGSPDQDYELVLRGPSGSIFTPGIGIEAVDIDGTAGADMDDRGLIIYEGTDGTIYVDPDITI